MMVCTVLRIGEPKGMGSNFSWQPKIHKVDCNVKFRSQHHIKNQATEHLCSIERKKNKRKKKSKFLLLFCYKPIFKKTTILINSQACKGKIQLTSELTSLFKLRSFSCHHFFALSSSAGSPVISVPLSTT